MKKAFTLVELIVVITILAILGTIGFISLNGYSASARDAKRISDISSLSSKINIEVVRGVSLSDLIIPNGENWELKSGNILGVLNTEIKTFGKINFNKLRETESNFKDPSTKNDYPVAYAVGTGMGLLRYNFFEIGTISEKEGVNKIVGNYYTLTQEDIPSLFLTGSTSEIRYINNGNTQGGLEDSNGGLIYKPSDKYIPPINEESNIPPTPTYSQCNTTTIDGYELTETEHGSITLGTKEGEYSEILGATSLLLKREYSCNDGIFELERELTQELTCEAGYVVNEENTICNVTACSGTAPDSSKGEINNSNQELNTGTWNYNEIPGLCTYTCADGYARIANECKASCNSTTLDGYSLTTGNHSIIQNPTKQVNITGGTQTKTTPYTCTNGTWNAGAESIINVSCNTGYNRIGNECLSGVSQVGTDLIVADGINAITIMDRNLGATEAGIGTNSYGNYYQWGNNYGFPNTGSLLTSTTRVDTSSYEVSTYSSNIFVITSEAPYDHSILQNDNLWGNTTNTNEARKGPCPEGYHIPTVDDWVNLIKVWVTSKGETYSSGTFTWIGEATLANFQNDLKIPFAGHRFGENSSSSSKGSRGYYWSSSPRSINQGISLNFSSSNINFPSGNSNYRSAGQSIRCFKN